MINKLEEIFGDSVSETRETQIPMGPGTSIERPADEEMKLDQDQQRSSGVEWECFYISLNTQDQTSAMQ
jgi:hypothetical protein